LTWKATSELYALDTATDSTTHNSSTQSDPKIQRKQQGKQGNIIESCVQTTHYTSEYPSCSILPQALLYQVNMHCFTRATATISMLLHGKQLSHVKVFQTIATMQVIQHHEAQLHQNRKTAGKEL
jgi:hypothetical protein